MNNETREILNRNFGGTSFPTMARAAIACICDNLTAGGFHEPSGAIRIAEETGAENVIAEIADNFDYDGDQVQELMDSWDDAINQLYEWKLFGGC